jgi:glycine/D-amino acid oxidase-like deaminating enzyme
MPNVDQRHATVRIMDARAYCRPEGRGLLVGVYEQEPLDVDPRGEVAGFEIANLRLDRTPLLRMIQPVRDELPILSGATSVERRGGLPTMTPDGHFIVDRAHEPAGLWILTGCNVGGLSTSSASGEDLATWIVTGERREDMRAFGLGGFMPGLRDERQLRARCKATYRHKYAHHEVLVN